MRLLRLCYYQERIAETICIICNCFWFQYNDIVGCIVYIVRDGNGINDSFILQAAEKKRCHWEIRVQVLASSQHNNPSCVLLISVLASSNRPQT